MNPNVNTGFYLTKGINTGSAIKRKHKRIETVRNKKQKKKKKEKRTGQNKVHILMFSK